MKLFSIPAIIALGLLTTGCTKKVDSDDLKTEVPYYQSYSVKYNKDDNKTEATAQFQVRETSGAKVELGDSSSVTANGKTPTTNFVDATLYKWDIDGIQDVNFLLLKEGKSIQNTVRTSDIGTVGFGTDFPATVSKADGFKFTWTGPDLENGETMTVTIRKLSVPIKSKTVTNREISFSASDLQTAVTGTLFVTLKREKEKIPESKDGTAGGKITVSYEVSKDLVLND